MQAALAPFQEAYATGMAIPVANFLAPTAPKHDPGRLYDFYRASNEHKVDGDVRYALKYNSNKTNRMSSKESSAWVDIIVHYYHAVGRIIEMEEAENKNRLTKDHALAVYETWKDFVNSFQKHVASGVLPAFAIFTLYFTANSLRKMAIRADRELAKSQPITYNTGLQDDIVPTTEHNEKLKEASRLFSKIHSLCTGDRNPDMSQSRKWGVYCIANLLFKTYFKLKAISLSKNIVRGIEANSDMPPFDMYPLPHRVTYKYYTGVIAFLQEEWEKAESALQYAWDHCLTACSNKERILMYLIPCRLVTKHQLPTAAILRQFPHAQRIFGDLIACIKKGDLAGFDQAFARGEPEFVKRRIFLTLERSREIALRNLLRKVFIAEGFEPLKEGQSENDKLRKTRVPISHFATALRMSSAGPGSQEPEDDEVECLLANQIYKGLMKGYISREHAMVVLNKKGAFPGTGV